MANLDISLFNVNDLAFAYGKPVASGVFKASVDDFKVNERLGFELTGSGEHQFLRIEKRGLNTEELVKRLAKCLAKPVKSISYAGLKDRQALTTQWLSVHCPGEVIQRVDWLEGDGWRVIDSGRHLKKLKIGGLASNMFTLVVREIVDCDAVDAHLQLVKTCGVPNYFGPQRFGHNGQNISRAQDMLLNGVRVKDRFLRGIYYSAARSCLFNRILSIRVDQHNWNKALSGDLMQLAGSHSIFPIGVPDETIHSRVAVNDLSPASSLWGRGDEMLSLDALAVQQQGLSGFESWCEALVQHGLEKAYRAHVLHVHNLTWHWEDTNLNLSFELPPGAYATSVLRELIVNRI